MFGCEMNSDSEDKMEGGNIFKKKMKGYNKKVKNSALGFRILWEIVLEWHMIKDRKN